MLQTATKPVQQTSASKIEFDHFKQDWKNIGLSTQSASREEAEIALKKVYDVAGLEAPRKIVWCGSPFSQGLTRAITLDPEFLDQTIKCVWKNVFNPSGTEFKNNIADCFRSSMRLFDTAGIKRDLFDTIKCDVRTAMMERLGTRMPEHVRNGVGQTVWDDVWQGVWNSIGDNLWGGIETGMRKVIATNKKIELDDSIRSNLQDCIGDCVKGRVWENPMDQAWGNIRNNISCQIRVQAWEGLWKTLQTSVWDNIATCIGEHVKASGNNSAQSSGYGQHDAYWLAFYAYFRETQGLSTETEAVSGLIDLAKLAGWFAPHAHICWICERPSVLSLDRNGRLHADEGPALAYPDGWGLHATEGTLRPPALQPV